MISHYKNIPVDHYVDLLSASSSIFPTMQNVKYSVTILKIGCGGYFVRIATNTQIVSTYKEALKLAANFLL